MSELAPDPWQRLRGLTAARIGLARSGASLATAPSLALRLAHAQARDAVAAELDPAALAKALGAPPLLVGSAASDRRVFLLRPDLGRRLAEGFILPTGPFDLALVLADGLSARAVMDHAPPLLAALQPMLANWHIGPIVAALQARVALGDAVAAAMQATAVVVLIGERPGLSAPDSLGAYVTWQPGPGTTDAARNCVSNIRPQGLPPVEAAEKLAWLLAQMRARGGSGVALKDDHQPAAMIATHHPR